MFGDRKGAILICWQIFGFYQYGGSCISHAQLQMYRATVTPENTINVSLVRQLHSVTLI